MDEYTPLICAIITQAKDDYISVCKSLKKTINPSKKLIAEKKELEQFFHSGYFDLLCGGCAEVVRTRIYAEAEEEANKAAEEVEEE